MKTRAALSFAFDVVAWLSPGAARSMTPAERGVYVDLLAYQCQKGFIPATEVEDPEMLARMCNTTPDEFMGIWKRLERKFTRTAAGDYVNAKLAEVMAPTHSEPPAGKVMTLPVQQTMFGGEPVETKPGKPSKNEVGELVAYFCQQWVTTHRPDDGKPPRLTRADKGQAATLVRDHGLNRAKEFVDRYLRDRDAWYLQQGHPLSMINRKVNAYRIGEGEAKPEPARRGHARASAKYDKTSDGTGDL